MVAWGYRLEKWHDSFLNVNVCLASPHSLASFSVQLPDLKNHLLSSQPCSASMRRAQPILPIEYTGIERAAKGLKIGLENALCLSIPASPSRTKLAKATTTTGQHMDIFHSSNQLVWERKFVLCSFGFCFCPLQSRYRHDVVFQTSVKKRP
jgi:hypothetical protein